MEQETHEGQKLVALNKHLRRGYQLAIREWNWLDTHKLTHRHPVCGDFWFYEGVIEHRHRDGSFTVRFKDNVWRPMVLLLRFTLNMQGEQAYHYRDQDGKFTLVPLTDAIRHTIKAQRLWHTCWSMGLSGMLALSEDELDVALPLARQASARWLEKVQREERARLEHFRFLG